MKLINRAIIVCAIAAILFVLGAALWNWDKAFAAEVTRSEELQTQYQALLTQRIKINEAILRIEGAFAERQRIEKEAEPVAEPEVEKEAAE